MLGTIARIAQIGFLVTATGVLGWFLWGKLKSEPRRELDAFRHTLAEEVVEEVVYELPRRDEIRKLVVLPVVGDLDGRVFDMLYDELEDVELYFLADDDFARTYIAEERSGKEPLSEPEAVAVGRALREQDAAIEGVLFTVLREFTDGRRGLGARVDMVASLLHIERGMVVPRGVVRAERTIDSRASLAFFTPYMQSSSLLLRIFGFVVFAGGLPFALFPVVRAVLRGRNTTHNIILVGALTLADVLFALVLVGLQPGVLGGFGLLLALLSGGIYNVELLEKLEQAV